MCFFSSFHSHAHFTNTHANSLLAVEIDVGVGGSTIECIHCVVQHAHLAREQFTVIDYNPLPVVLSHLVLHKLIFIHHCAMRDKHRSRRHGDDQIYIEVEQQNYIGDEALKLSN